MNSLLVRILLWLLVQPVDPCLDELELAARNVERQHDALFLQVLIFTGNQLGLFQLEDAKARFDEVVRKAQTEGVQRVMVRGHEAVAVIAVDELDRLLSAQQSKPLIEFMEGLRLHELDLDRESDRERVVDPPIARVADRER